jgi:hypothetical protein
MSESQTESKLRKGSCTYRVHSPICIRASGAWIPAGVIADLSDCSDAFLGWALKGGMIETADPSDAEPLFNMATGAVERPPCRNCNE